MKKLIVLFLLLFSVNFICTSYAHAENLTVTDYSGIISDGTKNYIKSKNDILFSQTEAKVIFVVVPSSDGMSTKDYCENLYYSRDINYIGRNNSVLFVVNTENMDYDFVVGTNISLALTDADVYEMIIHNFEPYFAGGEYDKAFLGLYNALGKWYETHYNDLNLSLDNNLDKYISGEINPEKITPKSNLWIWITLGACVVILIIILKIKQKVKLRIRKHEREKLRRKYKIDIDKIVNS